jgi:hypothetical protein
VVVQPIPPRLGEKNQPVDEFFELLKPIGIIGLRSLTPIKVPAGTYMAVRVGTGGSNVDTSSSLTVPLTESSWYTPGIGLVKRTSHPRDRFFDKSSLMLEVVLKSFTPGKE